MKFGGDDSLNLTQNTPEEQSEAGEPPAPGMQTSLMQMPSASAFTRGTPDRGGDPTSRAARANPLQRNLQKSSNISPADALKDFSNYPQMSALRPMDGNYEALNTNK